MNKLNLHQKQTALKVRNSQSKPLRALIACFNIILIFGLCTHAQEPSESVDQQQPIYARENAKAWLAKMASAMSTLNYQISFVVLKPGTDSQPYMWRHGITANGVEMEQLNLLNGPGREVLRVGEQVSYFEPNVPPFSLRSKVINGPLPNAFFQDPLSLRDSYDFVLVGRSRVSGRASQQIRIVSRDKSRFGFNLWLDQETGLLLKLNIVDLNGKLLEQVQVTELQVTPTLHPYLERIELAKLPPIVKIRPAAESQKKWSIEFLPLGMKTVKWDVHRLPLDGGLVEYVMLSDGLVDVSVYLQNASSNASEDLLLRHESTTFLTRKNGPVQVTVIGKVPAQTANAIASSIKLMN